MLDHSYDGTIVRIIDGDTLVLSIALGIDGLTLAERHCRLRGINTDDLHSADPVRKALAEKALARVEELCPVGIGVRLDTNGKVEKFGRLLIELYAYGRALSVNDTLLAENLAVPYDGHGPRN